MIPPTLTPEQRRVAGERALTARRARAEAKAALKARVLSVGDLLERALHDEALARMTVLDMLESLPSIGPTKAHALMGRLGISPSRRIRGLGQHQRAALLEVFA